MQWDGSAIFRKQIFSALVTHIEQKGRRVKWQLDILTGSHPFRPGLETPQSISLPISLLRGSAFTATQGFRVSSFPPPAAVNQYCTVVWARAQKDLLLHGDPRPVNAWAVCYTFLQRAFHWTETPKWACVDRTPKHEHVRTTRPCWEWGKWGGKK